MAPRGPPAIPSSKDCEETPPYFPTHASKNHHADRPNPPTAYPAIVTCHLSTSPSPQDLSKPNPQKQPCEKAEVSFCPSYEPLESPADTSKGIPGFGNLVVTGDTDVSTSNSSRGALYESLQGSGRWVGGQVGKLVSHAGEQKRATSCRPTQGLV